MPRRRRRTRLSLQLLLATSCGYRGPLFVEKPLALRSDAPIFRDWPHPVTMVGYNWRFHPEVAPLSALLASGGTLRLDMRTDIAKWPGAAYSDPLLECSHEVDLAYAWLGAPTSVQGGSLDGRQGGAWLEMVHRNSASSFIDLHWRSEHPSRSYLFLPDGGTKVLAQLATRIGAPAVDRSYEIEIANFLRNVETFERSRTINGRGCSFADGLRVIEICERVKESIG
jgi:predicted dehydrogenase